MSRSAASGGERFHVAAPSASLFSLQSAHARIYIHFCGAIHFTPVQLKALWCSRTQDEQLIEQHETSSSLSLNKLHAPAKFRRSRFVVAAGVIKSCPFKIKSGSRFVNARREWALFLRPRRVFLPLCGILASPSLCQYVCTKWKTFHHANSSSSTFMWQMMGNFARDTHRLRSHTHNGAGRATECSHLNFSLD